MSLARQIRTTALAAVLLGSSQCATTSVMSSWHDSSYASGSLKHPLVLAVARRPAVREKLEDSVVAALREVGVDAAASHRMFPDSALSEGTIADRLPTTDRDSLMITHLVDVKTESYEVATPYETSPAYADRWGAYYTHRYNIVGSPLYQDYDTYDVRKYVLRTNLYDAKNDKLVWTVLTQSEEPAKLDAAMRSFASAIVNRAEKDRVF